MTTVTAETHIDASPDVVFHAISDIEGMPKTNPQVVRVAFLTEQRQGVGTRFRETRRMNGKEHHFDLEVRDFDAGARRVRYVTDTHGTTWDTTVSVSPDGDGARVHFAMACLGRTALKRLLNRVLQGMYRRGMVEHVAVLKDYCESR
ncbi:MAG: SRPBCC family protein [Myxococcales bacterium]|nr:SRPBCC family protein [Myxococcales bacterium]